MHPNTVYQHVSSIPYAALSSSPLFADYCTRYGRVAGFYNGDFRNPDDLRAALRRTLAVDRDRDALVDALTAQQARWGVDEATRQSLETLRSPRAGAVITGQQLGLFVSPLYTIYKTLTTIQLARHLSDTSGHPVVPVFWLAGEDHDFEEIASLTLLNGSDLSDVTYPEPPLAAGAVNAGPVGRLPVAPAIDDLIARVGDALPRTDVTPDLLALLRDAYRPGVPMEDAFARVLRHLLPGTGLIIASIDDPAMKRLAAPLFEREARDCAGSNARLAAASEALIAAGYHAQVTTQPTNLFVMDPEGRLPVDAEGGRFRLRGTTHEWSEAELIRTIRETPERFSPNVVLRPILQDLLFPTVAYVAGPGETAYFAQYRGVYDWAEVPMPIIYPRVSVSLLEPAVRKHLDQYPFALPDYARGAEKLLKETAASRMPASYEAAYARAMEAFDAHLDALKKEAGEIDATLERSAESSRVRIHRTMSRLHDRMVRGQKRNMDIDRQRIERIAAHLFPHGKPQERALSPLHLLNEYGLDFFVRLMDRLPLDTWEHHVLDT
ncbi:MAG: bacillithiol biosynthesis cysteine-adding enzyme BshC [Rhodothermales bacterium]